MLGALANALAVSARTDIGIDATSTNKDPFKLFIIAPRHIAVRRTVNFTLWFLKTHFDIFHNVAHARI